MVVVTQNNVNKLTNFRYCLLSIIATAVFNKRASSSLSSEDSLDEEDELSPKYCVHTVKITMSSVSISSSAIFARNYEFIYQQHVHAYFQVKQSLWLNDVFVFSFAALNKRHTTFTKLWLERNALINTWLLTFRAWYGRLNKKWWRLTSFMGPNTQQLLNNSRKGKFILWMIVPKHF